MHHHIAQNLLESADSGAAMLMQLSARMGCSHDRLRLVRVKGQIDSFREMPSSLSEETVRPDFLNWN